MLIKLDLENPFDKLEWWFIKIMLDSITIAGNLSKLILPCVSNISSSILINGKSTLELNNTRGIKQGDPLAYYLFILSFGYLFLLIK